MIQAKIENLLGFDEKISVENKKPIKSPWPDDEYLTNIRHHESRFCEKYPDSEKWIIDKMSLGDNRWAHYTFNFFMFVGVMLICAILFIWLINMEMIPDYIDILQTNNSTSIIN